MKQKKSKKPPGKKRGRSKKNYTIARAKEEILATAKLKYSKGYYRVIELTVNKLGIYFGANSPIKNITPKDAERFILYTRETAPNAYINYYRTLKAIFNNLKTWKIIKENPFLGWTIPTKQEESTATITTNELIRVLTLENNKTIRALYLTAFYTGMRPSELTSLKWRNVELDERRIIVGVSGQTTKTRKPRLIPIHDEVHRELTSLMLEDSTPDDYVFAKDNGTNKYTTEYISKRFKTKARQAGLGEEIHLYSLRHSFATTLVNTGENVARIQSLMGHSNISTTQKYMHPSEEALTQSIASIPSISEMGYKEAKDIATNNSLPLINWVSNTFLDKVKAKTYLTKNSIIISKITPDRKKLDTTNWVSIKELIKEKKIIRIPATLMQAYQ